jgi:hypothetical protein
LIIDEESYLAHYGILRKSGRYPWGSGGTQSERNQTFLSTVDGLRRQGLSDTEIARGFSTPEHPFTTTMLRAANSIAKNQEKQANILMAQRLKDKGWSNVAIGQRMGLNESSVRALLAPGQKDKADILEATSNLLKSEVEKRGYIDVGTGVERHLDISDTKLKTAVARLREDGYTLHYVKVEQLGTGKQTTRKVLAKPGTSYSEVFRNRHNIQLVRGYSEDGGRSYLGLQPPLSISSKRVGVRYAEEGGSAADGVIFVRPGVNDLSLGKSRYAQVRIAVDGTHYLKGMAMYKDDLPDGVDLLFNTNKSKTSNKLDAMKPLKDDPDNPFGSVVRQLTGPDGKLKSAMNIVNEEGDWGKWSKTLSSQMLSKQSPSLARAQLDFASERKRQELSDILKLTNPVVKQKLLLEFADSADASSVHLKAAALPRQANRVILPISSMKPNEIYSPGHNNGELVSLVRHPHGGTFEIPELIVNNRNPEAKKLLGTNPRDAVGIHHTVAERLSGADFDGDTVLVIPNNNKRVKSTPALEGLKSFDPMTYRIPKDSPIRKMTAKQKAFEMGDVSNLITDMTIQGANTTELARAVRHSMVVIDAEKHELNYKQSAIDNGIAQLKTKYQGKANAGAHTLISRASSDLRVNERKQGYRVDPVTGKKIFTETGATFTNRQGKVVPRTQRSTKLAETDDANTLSSGTVIEKVYANHSNKMKAMANEARRAAVSIKTTPASPSAKTAYKKQVDSLNAKLNIALMNAPLERQAQTLANAVVSQKRQANPDMDAADVKKIKGQALTEARLRIGARKQRIDLTDEEWQAVQAGAISNDKLKKILANTDAERIKELATPKAALLMTPSKKQRALQMLALGYTQAEVASHLGVSITTLENGVNEGG